MGLITPATVRQSVETHVSSSDFFYRLSTRCTRRTKALSQTVLIVCLFACSLSFSDITNPQQAKVQLANLNQQIASLEDHLNHAQNKRTLLTQELRLTEKKIDAILRQLSPLKDKIADHNQSIALMRTKIDQLNRDLRSQTCLLSTHLKIFYQTRYLHPVKWFVDPQAAHTQNRLAIYSEYLMQARHQLIEQIQTTKKIVFEQQLSLNKKLSLQSNLERGLKERQQQLEDSKHYQVVVLNRLTHTIETKQSTLGEYQQDRKKLTELLDHLVKMSPLLNGAHFEDLRQKFSKPLVYRRTNVQKMHQGLTFFAPEGTPVLAAYSGKVVFSDWLKGYGLLLILDHGQGYMTLYGNNQTLLKKQGESVLRNEIIAAVGHTGGLHQDGLYFEIRHRGKALPPSDWFF